MATHATLADNIMAGSLLKAFLIQAILREVC